MGSQTRSFLTARRAVVLVAALALAGCGGVQTAPGPTCAEGVAVCTTPLDCGGNLCVSGCCTSDRVCGSDDECQGGARCVGGLCSALLAGCDSDAGCDPLGPTPRCDPAAHACVACLDDASCSTDGSRVCNLTTHSCEDGVGGCSKDAQCSEDGLRKCRKLPAPGTCVACTTDGDCFGGNKCLGNVCLVPNVGCATDAACSGSTPKCNPGTQTCVACLNNTHCGAGRLCTGFECVLVATPECTTSAQCPGAEICVDEVCTEPTTPTGCADDSDCPGEVCEPTSHSCVECVDSYDCAYDESCVDTVCVKEGDGTCSRNQDCAAFPRFPYCDTYYGYCAQCLYDSHCASDETCDEGLCFEAPSGCSSDYDCPGYAAPLCHPYWEECVECVYNWDCPGYLLCNFDGECY